MSPDPGGPVDREQLLVDRLGLSPELVAAVAAAARSEDATVPLDTPGLEDAFRAGVVQSLREPVGVDPWCLSFLRGDPGLSNRMAALTVPLPPVGGPWADRLVNILKFRSIFVEVVAAETSLAPAHAAAALESLGFSAVLIDLADISIHDLLADVLPQLYREARLLGIAPVLLGHDALDEARDVLAAIQEAMWPTVLVVPRRSRKYTPRDPFATLEIAEDDRESRAAAWSLLLPDGGASVDVEVLAHLPLGLKEMAETYERCASIAAGEDASLTTEDLVSVGRSVLMEGASRLAQLRVPKLSREDLVLAPDLDAALDELIAAARTMLARDPRDRAGLRALLTGPSGTGKTAATEALGDAIGVPVLFVDASRVVDKYIGETEKNLDRVLLEAERSHALLVFDEGESLFARRTQGASTGGVEASNRQVAYLLGRLEQHRGMAVVASNYPGAIDAAFTRRFHFTLAFKLPSTEQRSDLWQTLLARHGVDGVGNLEELATYELTGGSIANVCFLASLLAPTHSGTSDELVRRLVRREYARLAKRLPEGLTAGAR